MHSFAENRCNKLSQKMFPDQLMNTFSKLYLLLSFIMIIYVFLITFF